MTLRGNRLLTQGLHERLHLAREANGRPRQDQPLPIARHARTMIRRLLYPALLPMSPLHVTSYTHIACSLLYLSLAAPAPPVPVPGREALRDGAYPDALN